MSGDPRDLKIRSLSFLKGGNSDTCYSINEPARHYAK